MQFYKIVSMVTLYLSSQQSLYKIFSIPQHVSFFISKMNYLTSQLLIEKEIEIIIPADPRTVMLLNLAYRI